MQEPYASVVARMQFYHWSLYMDNLAKQPKFVLFAILLGNIQFQGEGGSLTFSSANVVPLWKISLHCCRCGLSLCVECGWGHQSVFNHIESIVCEPHASVTQSPSKNASAQGITLNSAQ